MKKLLLLLVSVIFVTACSNEDPEVPVVKADRTVMAYFVANNNLETDLRHNIVDLYKGLQQMKSACTLLIYWDGTGSGTDRWTKPCILRYVADGKGKVNADYGVTDENKMLASAEIIKEYATQLATDKAIMIQVLKDMIGSSPANSYGLIAGSHGSGWLHRIDGANARSFGQDGRGSNHTIQSADMADALAATGVEYDFILFDACLMGCAEVYYDFRHVANYAIASVIDVPAPGFPYHQMLPYLYGDVETYKEACRVYIDHYNKETSLGIKFGTISLIDFAEVENLTNRVREQLVLHKSEIKSLDTDKLQYYGEGNFTYYAADMQQIIKELNGGSVPTEFQQQLDKTVLYTDYVRDTRYFQIDGSNYSGMAMYVPLASKNYWNANFKTLSWYTAAGWDQVNWGF